jgi:hypothetical protein
MAAIRILFRMNSVQFTFNMRIKTLVLFIYFFSNYGGKDHVIYFSFQNHSAHEGT